MTTFASRMLRTGPAWSTAVLVTTAIASVVQSWVLEASVASSASVQQNLAAALPVMAVFAAALALGYALAVVLKPGLPILAPTVWPFAGAAAVGATLGFLHAQQRLTLLAGARGADMFVLLCGAGAIGGLVFAWLKPRSPPTGA